MRLAVTSMASMSSTCRLGVPRLAVVVASGDQPVAIRRRAPRASSMARGSRAAARRWASAERRGAQRHFRPHQRAAVDDPEAARIQRREDGFELVAGPHGDLDGGRFGRRGDSAAAAPARSNARHRPDAPSAPRASPARPHPQHALARLERKPVTSATRSSMAGRIEPVQRAVQPDFERALLQRFIGVAAVASRVRAPSRRGIPPAAGPRLSSAGATLTDHSHARAEGRRSMPQLQLSPPRISSSSPAATTVVDASPAARRQHHAPFAHAHARGVAGHAAPGTACRRGALRPPASRCVSGGPALSPPESTYRRAFEQRHADRGRRIAGACCRSRRSDNASPER